MGNGAVFKKILDEMEKIPCLEYGFITGGALRKEERDRDVDTVLVLKSQPDLESVRAFVRNNARIQSEAGYVPDIQFPTEMPSTAQIEDCVGGRAFKVTEKGIYLPNYSDEVVMNYPEGDYKYWLYMLICHNNEVFTGNRASFENATAAAMEIVFLYTAEKYSYRSTVNSGQLAQELLESGGNRKYPMHPTLFAKCLTMLEERGLASTRKSGTVELSPSEIATRTARLKTKILSESFQASHFVKSADFRAALKA